jgi:TetR/AcrR family transcriptional regulator, repressor for uid operon
MMEKTKRVETVEARRRLIIAAAAACFVKQGFHQTSIRDIANRAGISLGNLYNHFKSKSALIAEISTLEAEDLSEIHIEISKVSDPDAALDRFVTLYLAYCGRLDHVILSAEIVAEALRNPTIASGFHENRKKLTTALAGIVERFGKSPGPRECLECAEFILDVLEGASLRFAFDEEQPDSKAIESINHSIRRLATR